MDMDQPHRASCGGKPVSRQEKSFDLPMIDPLQLEGAEAVADLIDKVYARSGFNGRRLAEAAHLYSRMLREDTTVCLTMAGAMTPIGMSGVVNSLIRFGFVDFIIATGANLYHDLHRPYNMPMMQGHFAVDDNELAETGIARIYDVFIGDEETLMATDRVILRTVSAIRSDEPLSTAEFHYALGREVRRTASRPEWSMLATAAEYDVPIYTSSPGDSSIAMNLTVPHLFESPVRLDPLKDVIDTAAIVRAASTNGVVIAGGGSPKNFYLQTQPTLHQIFLDDKPAGHDYVIQLSADSPQWGGLSGATPSEARSWGKVRDAFINNVVVYSCASLTLPLLAQYVLVRNQPRPHKRLMPRVNGLAEELRQASERNPRFRKSLELIRKQVGQALPGCGTSTPPLAAPTGQTSGPHRPVRGPGHSGPVA
jgi:deoxyhypusine synthase